MSSLQIVQLLSAAQNGSAVCPTSGLLRVNLIEYRLYSTLPLFLILRAELFCNTLTSY